MLVRAAGTENWIDFWTRRDCKESTFPGFRWIKFIRRPAGSGPKWLLEYVSVFAL